MNRVIEDIVEYVKQKRGNADKNHTKLVEKISEQKIFLRAAWRL